MPTPILMPALSPTMEEGKLAKWLVQRGDQVQAGDPIAEIETDKATMEVEAVEDGTIGEILVQEGAENVRVNQPIATLLTDDEDEAAEPGPSAPRPASRRDENDVTTKPEPQQTSGQGVAALRTEEDGTERTLHHIAEQIRRNGKGEEGDRIFASPLARRIARDRGIDLSALSGSGPRGRIVKADVLRAGERRRPEEAEAVSEPRAVMHRPPPGRAATTPAISDEAIRALYEPGSYEIVPHDTMRRVLADRVTLSKGTVPHFYLTIDCRIDALLASRARLNDMAPQEGPRAFKLSVNDFIVKAMAMALQEVPAANAVWTEEGMLRLRPSDIAVAVALEGGGLHTPVIRDAEVKSLSEISNEMKDLAARARSKRLAPHEYQGGATTISNLGMYGIDRFDAIINPPQSSILAVGRAEKKPVIKDDAVKIATMMSVTLSVDHRVIDGALGAELLHAFKTFIEEPVTMLV
jgi:pyruvate dehydrogenase E2 component (dihydrolipoamide acetyltransferase)